MSVARTKRALSLVVWTWGAMLALSVVYGLARAILFTKLKSADDFESVISTFRTFESAFSTLHVAVAMVSILAYASLARADRRMATLGWIAVACAIINVKSSVMWAYGTFAEKPLWGPDTQLLVFRVFTVSLIVEIGVLVAAIYRLSGRDSRALSFGVPALVCQIVLSCVYLGNTFGDGLEFLRSDNPWMWPTISITLNVGLYGFAIAMARRARETLGVSSEPEEREGWRLGAAGLGLFASALHARIWIALIGVVLLMMAVFARSIGMVKAFAVLIPLASAITAGFMFWGLMRFRLTPRPDSIRGPVTAAMVIFILAFCVELTGVMQVISALSNPAELVSMESRLTFDTAIQVLVLIGFVIVLSSMTRIADHLGESEIAARAGNLHMLIIGVFGIAGVLRYATMKGELVREPAMAALLLIGVGIAMVAAVVKYAGVARELSHVMEDRATIGGAPARAVIVNAGGDE